MKEVFTSTNEDKLEVEALLSLDHDPLEVSSLILVYILQPHSIHRPLLNAHTNLLTILVIWIQT